MKAKINTPNGDIEIDIDSEDSAPFIVLSNESQWDECEFILFKRECFNDDDVRLMKGDGREGGRENGKIIDY